VVDQTVLWRIFFGFQSSEESFFGSENLNGGSWVFGQVDQVTGVGDQSGADEFTNEKGQIWSDGLHSVFEVFVEFCSVFGQLNDSIGEVVNGEKIFVRDFATHGELSGVFELFFDVFWKDSGKIGFFGGFSETHGSHDSSVGEVISNDFGHFWKMPSVPFPHPHHHVVKLFVQIVQQANRLNDHSIDLIWRKLQLVPGQTMRQTKSHTGGFVGGNTVSSQIGQMLSNDSHEFRGSVVENALNRVLFFDQLSEFSIGDHEFFGGVDFLQKFLQRFRDFGFDQSGGALEGFGGVSNRLEFFEGEVFAGFFGRARSENVLDVIDFGDFGAVVDFENTVTGGGFEEKKHFEFL
jgi:hypothetical protein